MKQVVFTRVNFLTENSMEMENIPYLMDINMKVIGKKMNTMVLENLLFQMVNIMKESIKTIKEMVLEYFI